MKKHITLLFLVSHALIYAAPNIDHCAVATNVGKAFTDELEKTTNLNLIGAGGSMMDTAQAYNFHFICNQQVDINQARTILLNCVNSLLARVNSSKLLRPYLSNYPFEAKNVRLRIRFADETGQPREVGLGGITTFDGVIYYSEYSRSKSDKFHVNGYRKVHEESFDEALQLINTEKSD